MSILKWINRLHKLWLAKDIDRIIAMFDENCEYWETPFQQIIGIENIRKEWDAIKALNDFQIEYSVLSSQKSHAIVNFRLETKTIKQDIVNEFKLANGKCIYLKQWYMEKMGSRRERVKRIGVKI